MWWEEVEETIRLMGEADYGIEALVYGGVLERRRYDFQTRREWAKLESRILVDGPRSSGDLHTSDFNLS